MKSLPQLLLVPLGVMSFCRPTLAQCGTWQTLTPNGTTDSSVKALATHDGGTGPALYAGGSFAAIDGVSAARVAKWNGVAWSPLGSGMSGPGSGSVGALLSVGSGPLAGLYAGGLFEQAGGASAVGVARWDGSTWSALSGSTITNVAALVLFDDGSGEALYVAGSLSLPFTVPAIAKWNGSTWTPLGSGLFGAHGSVAAMTVFDDGTGPALFVAGNFSTAGGVTAIDIAKWNGTAWSALPNGIDDPYDGIGALAVFDDGTGAALYVSGRHPVGVSGSTSNIAKWDGTAWSPVGNDLDGAVSELVVLDGTGAALYAAGDFTASGTTSASHVARWDGTSWSPLGTGLVGATYALCVIDSSGLAGARLVAGGDFSMAGGQPASRVAQWNTCYVEGYCAGDGSGTACPCGNTGASGHGCGNSIIPAGGLLSASGAPQVAHDTFVLQGSGLPSSFALYFQGTSETLGGAGAVFRDGLRCASGQVIRLGVKLSSGNSSMYPAAGDIPISLRGAIPPSGGMRVYQAWYRNVSGPCGMGSNMTNGLRVLWQP